MIAIGGLVAVVAGVTLAIVLIPDDHPPGSPSAPGTTSASVPIRNPQSAPPWGFNGSGWQDFCYRSIDTPPGYIQQSVSDSESCPGGATRVSGLTLIQLTAQAGADADRLGTTWGTIQPRPPSQSAPPGEPRFEWGPVVRRYLAMLRDGIRPVVVAWGSPGWARVPGWDRPGSCSAPGGTGCAFPPAPRHLTQWRTYLRGLMTHMPDMRALEIWNEPNSARFFAPRPNPALYAQMLRAANQAAEAVGFDRPILTGGLAPERPLREGKMPPARFLSRVYELAGRRAFDGIGTHPYPAGPPWVANMNGNLDQLRAVKDRFHDSRKPLWITEVGLGGTEDGVGHFAVPLDRQGPVLTRMFRSIQGSDVRAFIVYTLYDSTIGGKRFGPYGVTSPRLQPKPAYCDLARRVGHTNACAGEGP